MAWPVEAGGSCALPMVTRSRKGATQSAARSLRNAGRFGLLIHPLVKMDSRGIFPGRAGHGMEVTWEDGGIHAEEPVIPLPGFLGGLGSFGCGCGIGGLGGPLLLDGGPIELLKVEIGKAVQFFGKLAARGLQVFGKRRGAWSAGLRNGGVQRLVFAGAEKEIRGHGEVIEIPLRHALCALTAFERNFQVSDVALVALGSDLVAEDGSQELESIGFVADS